MVKKVFFKQMIMEQRFAQCSPRRYSTYSPGHVKKHVAMLLLFDVN
jgi:hypothetical protein